MVIERKGLVRVLVAVVAVVGLAACQPPVPSAVPGATAVAETASGPVGFFSLATPAPPRAVTLSGTTATTLTVAGVGGVAPAAQLTAVAVNVTVTTPTSSAGLKVWPSGAAEPTATSMLFSAGSTQSTLVTARVGADGKVALRSTGTGSTPVSLVVVGFYGLQQSCGSGCTYHNRFLPARGTTLFDGFARPRHAGQVLTEASPAVLLPIHDVAGVPATATRAVLRVAVVPETPFANSRRVDVRAKGATDTPPQQRVGFNGSNGITKVITTTVAEGAVELLVPDTPGNDGANLRVVVDLVGHHADGAYAAAARAAHPEGVLAPFTIVRGTAVPLDVRAMGGLPASYSTFRGAVVLDVTVSGATSAGSVSLGGGVPHVSFRAGQTAANQVIVPITGATPTLSATYRPATGTRPERATVRVTPVGSFQLGNHTDPAANPGDLFAPVAPSSSTFAATPVGGVVTLSVLGVAGVPTTGVSRVALQVSSRDAAGRTEVRVTGGDRPLLERAQLTTSGQRATTSVIADVGRDGKVRLAVGSGRTTIDVSIVGWLTPYVGNGFHASSVAVYGDSITQLASNEVMAALEDTHRIGAFAAPGFQADGLAWWADLAAITRPRQVVVYLGTNDAWVGGVTAAETRDAIVAQVAGFTTATCRFIVTVNNQTTGGVGYGPRATAINAELRPLPQPGNRIGLLDWDAYLAHLTTTRPVSDYISGDGIHPTNAGTAALAELYEAGITGQPAHPAADFVTPCS